MKSFVRNTAAAEGCIAECYVGDEVVTFVGRYYEGTQSEGPRRVDDAPDSVLTSSNSLFPMIGKPSGASEIHYLSRTELLQAQRHVLTNCSAVDSYRE